MATYTTSTGQAGTLRIIVSYTQNTTNNTTTFSGRYELSCAWSATYTNGIGWSSSSAGQGDSGTFSISGVTTITLDTFSVTKTHASDGTLGNQTFSITMNATGTSGLGGPTTFSKSISVPTIPRASTPSTNSPKDAGSVLNVDGNPLSTSFRFDFSYSFGSASGTIQNDVNDNYDWTVPMALLDQIPNATSGVGTITSKTKTGAGGSVIGTKTCSFTITAGTAVKPTFSGKSHSDNNATVASVVGAYVQGLSKLNLAITGAAGAYSSTITDYKYTVGSLVTSVTSASGTMTNPILDSGPVDVVFEVKDSRGRVYSETQSITVLAYDAPTITDVSVQRCASNGVVDTETGTYLRINLNAAVQSLINSTERNDLSYTIETRPTGGSWTTKGTWSASAVAYNSYRVVGAGDYSLSQSYEVRVTVSDEFQSVVATRSVGTAQVPLDVAATGIGVGKIHEQGALDVAGDAYISGNIYNTGFAGCIAEFGGSTPPTGWLLCDGAAVSRTTYATLFAVIGTTYGVGDGSTTFNVPDFRSRVPVGRDVTSSDFINLGDTGGETEHELTLDEQAPPQIGTLSDYGGEPLRGITITTNTAGRTSATGWTFLGGIPGPVGGWDTRGTGTQDPLANDVDPMHIMFSTADTAAPHNNLQPFVTVNYIISTGALIPAGLQAVVTEGSGVTVSGQGTALDPWVVALEDTGWITSGLSFSPATNWTVVEYELRKLGKRVFGQIKLAYSGSTLTPGTDMNIGDQNAIITMPTGWQVTSVLEVFGHAAKSGVATYGMRFMGTGTPGRVDLTHAETNLAIASGDHIRVMIDYPI